jgi:hypothetical protein
MQTNTQEAVLSAYIVSIGKRTPREAAQDAAELCRLANSEGTDGILLFPDTQSAESPR